MEAPNVFMDGWLEDDDDGLDLRLALHDYNKDVAESCHHSPTQSIHPSLFRRRLSISTKLASFSRSSVSSSRPPSKSSAVAPDHALHARRKSRTLSLINPRHRGQPSLASIDAAAAHYSDPDARSKLRAYLASPQKFDEALEYGFLAAEPHPTPLQLELPALDPGFSPTPPAAGQTNETLRSFLLVDDASSMYSQDVSTADPESPTTPLTLEAQPQGTKPLHLSGNVATVPSKLSDGQALEPVASREMTMRITLTRPDLRSEAGSLHSWQKPQLQHWQPSSQPLSSRSDTPSSTLRTNQATKLSLDRIFADIDQELGPAASDGAVRRFWKRVRRN